MKNHFTLPTSHKVQRIHLGHQTYFLRQEIVHRMCEHLIGIRLIPDCIVDAGCVEGDHLATLQQRFSRAQFIRLEAALPNAIDLIWSPLLLHWQPYPDHILRHWHTLLRTEGLLMFSCFGPDTFKELRIAFDQLDTCSHVLPFTDMHDVGDMLINAGFVSPILDMEIITVTYDTLEKLWVDIRAWGGNLSPSRRHGLIGRQAWQRVLHRLHAMRHADKRFPLTYEIIYGHAFKASSISSDHQPIKFFPYSS